MRYLGTALSIALCAAACGDDGPHDLPPDAPTVSTEKCDYVPVAATANAGTAVAAAPLSAGASERVLDVPVGTALGGYTARAGFLSGGQMHVDSRSVPISGTFNPSIGVEAAPRVKALALAAGGETVVILKMDAIFVYEGMLFDVEQALGAQFAGKVIIASSHSHSAWAQFSGHGPLKLGSGQLRDVVYKRFVSTLVDAAQDALAHLEPAKLGVFADEHFDPGDVISHDRRGENDMLPGGDRKDDHLYMIRVDHTDGTPLAALMVFGEHGTLQGEDNPFASVDAPGSLERVMQEQFDSNVVVMHLQSAGADTSPAGHGGLDCNQKPGKDTDPCLPFTTEEGHGRAALPILMAAYDAAGAQMRDQLELAMITRSVETGPYPETFSIRGGALTYAPHDPAKPADGVIYAADGKTLVSPIDEFNAPVGAALCQDATPMFPAAAIDGTDGVAPYGSCLKLAEAAEILGPLFQIDFGVDATHPVCESTRTTISALRLGDYVIGTLPGEVSVLLADLVRSKSPKDGAHTIVVGYSQGHVGYMLRPEDWMLGGYEPSVTFWGPLEAEYLAERLIDLMPTSLMPTRQDGAAGGTTRLAVAQITDGLPIDEPAPMAGTVPAAIPAVTWARTGTPAHAQPDATIPRIAGVATFVFVGDDPLTQTPHVTLQREVGGAYQTVTRRSGRAVQDAEVLLAYTPSPLQRGSDPQTHVWVAEWQAVPWLGAPGADSLGARGNVPLGNYRFHVEGHGWTLDSQPFAVVHGGAQLAGVARGAGAIKATVQWFAPKGWRLMDMDLPSNQPVPVRAASVTVELRTAGGVSLGAVAATTDGTGAVTVPDNALATSVQVTDPYGNLATAALP